MEKQINDLLKLVEKISKNAPNEDDIKKICLMIIVVTHNNRDKLKDLMKEDIEYLIKSYREKGSSLELSDSIDISKNNIDFSELMLLYKEFKYLDSTLDLYIIDSLSFNELDFISSPESISKLVLNILQPQAHESIYDPTFGTGSMFTSLLKENNQQEIVGYEINQFVTDIAKIRMYLMDSQNTYVVNDNSLIANNEYIDSKNYDIAISSPPFGAIPKGINWDSIIADHMNRYKYGIPTQSNMDWAFIMESISKLSSDGRAMFIVSNSTLFKSGQSSQIRENFLVADLIECVISLPSGLLLPDTGIPISLLLCNKNKKRLHNQVLLINANQFEVNKDKYVTKLTDNSISKIINLFENAKEVEDESTIIKVEDLRKNESIILPDRYVKSNIFELEDGRLIKLNRQRMDKVCNVRLSDIAKIYRGFNVTAKEEDEQGKYKLIKISDLLDDRVFYGNLSRTNAKKNTKVENYQIQKGDILLTIRGMNEKIALVTEDSENTLITQNIVGIRPDPNKVNSKWLMKYFNSPLGLAQLDSIKVGTVISQIPLKSLNDLEISIVDLEEQEKAIKGYEKEFNLLEEEYRNLMEKYEKLDLELFEKMKIADLYSFIKK